MTSWLRNWIQRHSRRVLESDDSTDEISRGIAIGMFFGFTPLFGLKTVLSIVFAWLCRGSKIAAVVAVALHDLALPFMPLILRAQYDVGYWLLSRPHQFPLHFDLEQFHPQQLMHWTTFFSVGKPLLVGSIIFGIPVAFVSYVISHKVVRISRARRKASARPGAPDHPVP
jgi:uncharacterized protein (DUF2062 family)